MQREAGAGTETSQPAAGNSGSGNTSNVQDSSFNYIFNLLLSSVSNNEGGSAPNADGMPDLNQSFGNQGNNSNGGGNNNEMNDN